MNPIEDKDNGHKKDINKGTNISPHPQSSHPGPSGKSDTSSSTKGLSLPHVNDTFAVFAGSLVIGFAILGSAFILGCYIRKAASVKTVVADVIRDLTKEAKKQIFDTITSKS